MTKVTELTENESRYLKLIYRKQYEESEKLKTTDLADLLKVSPATVTEVLQRLDEKALITHKRYKGVELTPKGILESRKLLRKHRILETLFVQYLGLNEKKACEEAFCIDFHASEELINSICRNYEHPKVCPCGKEIFGSPECENG